MADKLISTIRGELNNRIDTLRLSQPLLELYSDSPLSDGFDKPKLALAIISYLIYQGYIQDRHIEFAEIKDFVTKYLIDEYELNKTDEELQAITREMVISLETTSRYRRIISTKSKEDDSKTIGYKEVYYSTTYIVRKEDGYQITPDCATLFLNMKEVREEAGVTNSFMFIKKQVEHGRFDKALQEEQVLEVLVTKRLKEKEEILNHFERGQENASQLYSEYVDKFFLHMESERDMFEDMKNLLDSFYHKELDRKDVTNEFSETLQQIIEIRNRMTRVQQLHYRLYDEVGSMRSEIHEIGKRRAKAGFRAVFNFEEAIDTFLNKTDDVRTLEALLSPLFNLNIRKRFAPELIFEKQRLKNTDILEKEIYEEPAEFEALPSSEIIIEARIENNYPIYLELFIRTLEQLGQFSILDWSKVINTYKRGDLLYNRDFLPFIYALYKMSIPDKNSHNVGYIMFSDIKKKSPDVQTLIEKALINLNRKTDFSKRYKGVKLEVYVDEEVAIHEITSLSNIVFSLIKGDVNHEE